MMEFNMLFEELTASPETVRLSDLYTYDEFKDESEALYDFSDDSDYEKEFTVHEMPPQSASKLQTFRNDTTVMDAYRRFARKEQKDIVKQKMRLYDKDRVVIVAGTTLLDGYHHVVASVLLGKPIKYINLHS